MFWSQRQLSLVIGDPASPPAINSLLEVEPKLPATIWFETSHDSDHDLPFRIDPERHDLRTVPRKNDQLVTDVKEQLPGLLGDPADAFVWIPPPPAHSRRTSSRNCPSRRPG